MKKTDTPLPSEGLAVPAKARRSGKLLKQMAFVVAGQKYGRLTVIRLHERSGQGKVWLCRCECGNEKLVKSNGLTCGCVKSCGCLYRETRKTAGAANRKHYGKGTRAYTLWKRIRRVCYCSRDPKFHIYGGRGIAMCDRWRLSFLDFYADVGDPPEGLSMDRIDVNGNYEPGNVRWATPRMQANNTRANKHYSLDGKTMSLADWGSELGIDPETLRARIARGWSIERSLTTPLQIAKHRTPNK